MKILKKKMKWEHFVFERMNVFLMKYGHESSVVLRKWMFFNKIWVWEHLFFCEKSEKKGILLTFFPCSFDRIDVFWTNYEHDSRGFFMENFQKRNEKTVFLREFLSGKRHPLKSVVRQNMGMRAGFLENGRFFDKIWVWG